MAKRIQVKFIGVRATRDTARGLEAGRLYDVDVSWAINCAMPSGALGIMGRPWVGGPSQKGPRYEDGSPFWVHALPGGNGDSNPDNVKLVFQAHV